MTVTDALRIILNLALAVAQIGTTYYFFRDGFQTAPGPYPLPGPTPIVPAGYAFAIWAPIFLGSLTFAIHQALPPQWQQPLFRQIGWFTALAFLGCVLWNAAAKYGPVLLTVPLLALIALALVGALAIAASAPPSGSGARFWLVMAPLGLYAGWATLATFANISEVLPEYGFQRFGLGEPWWTLLLLAAVMATSALGFWLVGGNPFYAGAVLWGLVAIAVANLGGERDGGPTIGLVAAAAAVLAAVALLMAIRAERG